jgi:hypothetical protein
MFEAHGTPVTELSALNSAVYTTGASKVLGRMLGGELPNTIGNLWAIRRAVRHANAAQPKRTNSSLTGCFNEGPC